MDDLDLLDLDALMGELEAVQEEQIGNRLAERSCIEIMMKLIATDQLDVLYTLDGRAYLTRPHLVKELQLEINRQGGRVLLSEMSSLLNVDSAYIDEAAETLLESEPTLRMLNHGTEIVGDVFLDNLALEINEYMEDAGSVSVGELATKYGLAVDFVQHLLTTRLASGRLTGTLRRNTLYSESFRARLEKRLVGALSAITRPTSLQSLVQRFEFLERSVVKDTATRLCTTHQLNGQVIDGDYVPDVFQKIQRNQCYDFFDSNGFMSKKRALTWKVTNLHQLLRVRWSSCLELSTCVVRENVKDILTSQIDDVVLTQTWLHVPSSLQPLTLDDPQDIRQLVQMSMAAQSAASTTASTTPPKEHLAEDGFEDVKRGGKGKTTMVLVEDTYLVTMQYVHKCRQSFQLKATAYAEQMAVERAKVPKGQQRGVSMETGEEYVIVESTSLSKKEKKGSGGGGGSGGNGGNGGNGGKGNKRGNNKKNKRKGKGKKGNNGGDEDEDDNGNNEEDDMMYGKGSKGKGRGKKKKKGRKGNISSDDEPEQDDLPSTLTDKQQSKRDKRKAKKAAKNGKNGGGGNSNGSHSNNSSSGIDPNYEAKKHVNSKMMTKALRTSFVDLNIDPNNQEDEEPNDENNELLVTAIVDYIMEDVSQMYVAAIETQFEKANRSHAEDMHKLLKNVQLLLIEQHSTLVTRNKGWSKLSSIVEGVTDQIKRQLFSGRRDDEDSEEVEDPEEVEEETNQIATANGLLSDLLNTLSSSLLSTVGMKVMALYTMSRFNEQDVEFLLAKIEALDALDESKDGAAPFPAASTATASDTALPTSTPAYRIMVLLSQDAALLRSFVAKVDPSIQKWLLNGLSTIKKGNQVDSFMESVDALAHECNLILKPNDKKMERNILFHSTNSLGDNLLEKTAVNHVVIFDVCTFLLSKMENIWVAFDRGTGSQSSGDSCTGHSIVFSTLLRLLTTVVSPSVSRLLLTLVAHLDDTEEEQVNLLDENDLVLNGIKGLLGAKKTQLRTMDVVGFEEVQED